MAQTDPTIAKGDVSARLFAQLETMNDIDLAGAKEEIGAGPFEKLELIAHYIDDTLCETGRMAQSIITRSEVELFGLSVPRFAVRLYFKHGGFINCRRLATLVKMFRIDNATEWGNRYSSAEIETDERHPDLMPDQSPHKDVQEVMANQSCVADCLLPEPWHLSQHDFRYVDASKARLLEAYSEDEKAQTGEFPPLLPYTQTVDLGGGLCAQAVSFIATALLAHYSRSVHGIAEITALAHPRRCRELSLGSLEPDAMIRYFENINLRLSEQCLTQSPSDRIPSLRTRSFASAIRCYVHAGMPVILPTNTKKLAGVPSKTQSIYWLNGLRDIGVGANEDHANENHLVIIVGATAERNYRFVFHDSATVPFLVADAGQLVNVGPMRIASREVSDNGIIMPVVPGAVSMPLLDERIYVPDPRDQNKRRIEGMRFGLQLLTELFHWNTDYPCVAKPALFPDRFRLIRSDMPNLGWGRSDSPHERAMECGLLRAVSRLEEDLIWRKPHWIWLEVYQRSVWLWDAEVEAPSILPTTRDEMLDLVYRRHLLSTIHVERTGDTAEITQFV